MTAPHRPYVVPFNDATKSWVARCDCGCGLFEQFGSEADAQAVADAAGEVTSDVE